MGSGVELRPRVARRTPKTTAAWLAQAPAGFIYVLKAPKRITHEQRLKGSGDTLTFFCESARVLEGHLGPLLFQLPPNLKCDLSRLEAFLRDLPADIRAAFEFRHESWLVPDVFAALRARGVALCIADMGDTTTPMEATARFGYFRLRDEGYVVADLDRWADDICACAREWDEVFVFFKHEEQGKGPAFANAFREILTRRGVTLA
jgi:uncharacterized protein YecE (DUF72 family)